MHWLEDLSIIALLLVFAATWHAREDEYQATHDHIAECISVDWVTDICVESPYFERYNTVEDEQPCG